MKIQKCVLFMENMIMLNGSEMKKETQIKKQVCFNPEYEKELLEFLKGKKFSTYIKKLIEKEMRK